MTSVHELLNSLVSSLKATCCASRDSNFPTNSVGLRSTELAVIRTSLVDDKLLPVSSETECIGQYTGQILHVDVSGKQKFKTIQSAIDAAESGDRIIVHSGRYTQTVNISKRLEIVGNGNVESVIICASEDFVESIISSRVEDCLLTMETAEARIRNLTFRMNHRGVVVENKCGDLIIEGCSIIGGATGIRVSNSASIIARYCDISGCSAHGAMANSCGWISLEKCYIANCVQGVFSKDLGTQCSIKECDIANSSQVGVVLYDEAQGLVEDSKLQGNLVAAVCLSGRARAVISGGELAGNKVGACVLEESSLAMRGAALTGNSDGPLVMTPRSARLVVVDALGPPSPAPAPSAPTPPTEERGAAI